MRLKISVSTLACAVFASACGDSTSPADSGFSKELRQVTLTFCPDYPPTWIAHQDDGGKWTPVTVGSSGKASFAGTERQAVALVHDYQDDVTIEVIYSTATTLGSVKCRAYASGTKHVKGSVAGLGDSYATLMLGDSYAGAGFGAPNFEFFTVKEGALDLVATRYAYGSGLGTIDKVIMRRAQNYADGTVLSLDFDSAEAFPLETHSITTTGGGASVFHSQDIVTSNGTELAIDYGSNGSTIKTIPAAKLVDGDLHHTTAMTGDASQRMVGHFYKDPSDLVLAFGPALSAPTMTTLSASPNQRLRAQIPTFTAYTTGASVSYRQDGAAFRGYTISVIGDYFTSLPTAWVIDMPDLSSVAGFKAAWRLSAAELDYATVIGVPLANLLGGSPAAGDTVRYAGWEPASLGTPGSAPTATARVRFEPWMQTFAPLRR